MPAEQLVFDGKEMTMTTKALVAHSKIKARTITTKKTRDGIKKNADATEMDPLNYVKIQKWIAEHRKMFFDDHKQAQINILTSKGWRAGNVFDPNGNISWFSAKQQYNEAMYDITTVYAVQILLF